MLHSISVSKYFQAAVLEAQQTPLTIRRLEIPETLYVGQVLVRVLYSGICGAQLGEIAGTKGPDRFLPHLMGHEGSGEVVAVGPGVRNLRLGDYVVLHWRKGIGIESNPPKYWCPELGKEVGGGWVTSFNEYAVVSENRLTKIGSDIPLDVAALMGCAVTTGLGVVNNDVRLKMGESVIVFGCGGVGLNVLQGCMLAGAYPIIGVDIADEKLQRAIVMGATHVANSREKNGINYNGGMSTIKDWIVKLTGRGGADAVIDTTGNPEVMRLAWELAAPTGRVCLVAQLRHDQTLPLQTLPMHTGKTILGSDGGDTNPTIDIPRYLRLYKAGRLNIRNLITHVVRLRDINSVLDDIRAGRVGRAIIEM